MVWICLSTKPFCCGDTQLLCNVSANQVMKFNWNKLSEPQFCLCPVSLTAIPPRNSYKKFETLAEVLSVFAFSDYLVRGRSNKAEIIISFRQVTYINHEQNMPEYGSEKTRILPHFTQRSTNLFRCFLWMKFQFRMPILLSLSSASKKLNNNDNNNKTAARIFVDYLEVKAAKLPFNRGGQTLLFTPNSKTLCSSSNPI